MSFIQTTSRARLVISVLLCASLSLVAACSRQDNSQTADAAGLTVFEGARVIVGDGSAPIENATITVREGRIEQVGPAGEVPSGATRVDVRGKTIMPGLVDAHIHPRSQERETLVEDLQRRAYYGVVAAMSMGQDPGDVAYQVREEVIPNAARFRTAGRGFSAPEPGRSTVPYWVSTEEEARKAVQELATRKPDIVKIWVDDRMGKYKRLTPALYGAIIDEAHTHGLRTTAHVWFLEDAKGLLRAGLDHFAHGVRDRDIDEELVTLFNERPNVMLVPNLPNRGVAADLSWLSESVPAGELQKLQAASADNAEEQKMYGLQARNLAKLQAAGVRIALGSDGNSPYAAHHEIADMVAAGLSPHDAIVAATRNGAELLRIDDIGTIAGGKSADFIVLDANPLDDITNTRRINAVYLRGVAVDRAGLRSKWMGQTTN